MKTNVNEIEINGVKYVPSGTEPRKLNTCKDDQGRTYSIVRCDRSGVFAGYVGSYTSRVVTIHRARRLWYWSGAASLSQLAMEGVKNPDRCKFPCEVPEIHVTDAIEFIACSQDAINSIASVQVWKA